MHAGKDRGHFRNDITCVAAAVVHESRIAFLRHGRRHVRVFSALLQNDPGTALGVLNHDVVDHGTDVHSYGSRNGRPFERKVNGCFARAVKGVEARTVKPEQFGHRVAVQRPTRTV